MAPAPSAREALERGRLIAGLGLGDQPGGGGGDALGAIIYGLSAYNSNAMLSGNPRSGVYEADTARTLDLNGGNPACNQGGEIVVALEGNGSRPSHQGNGYTESGVGYTLNTTEQHAVCYCKGTRPHNANEGQEWKEAGAANTINTFDQGATRANELVVAFTQNQRNELRDLGDTAAAIAAEQGTHQTNYLATFCASKVFYYGKPLNDQANTLLATDYKAAPIVYQVCNADGSCAGDIAPTCVGVHNAFISDYTAVVAAFCPEESTKTRGVGYDENNAPTPRAGATPACLVYDARGNGDGGIAPNITGDHENRVSDYTALVVGVDGYNAAETGDAAATLGVNAGISMGRNGVLLVLNDQGGESINVEKSELSPTLRAQSKQHDPVILAFEPGAESRVGGHSYTDGTAGTLRANPGDNLPTVLAFHAAGDRSDPTISTSDAAYCLPANPMSDRGQGVLCVRERCGCEGGGKGLLVQQDASGTIATGNDQFLCYAGAWDGGEASPTLTASNACGRQHMPDKGSFNAIVILDRAAYNQGANAQFDPGIDVSGTAHTIVARGPGAVCYAVDMGGGKSACGVSEGQSPTLACTHGGEPAVSYVLVVPYERKPNAREILNLNKDDYQSKAVLDPDGIAPALYAGESRYGGGELYVLITADGTPAERDDGKPVCYTVSARSEDGSVLLLTPVDVVLRRLTPVECARLQGMPDWWCKDLGVSDPTEEEMAFWREVFETHRRIVTGASKPKTDKQIRKWLADPYSYSAEYKLWGNGMALPCVLYVMENVKRVLDLYSLGIADAR